MTPEKLNENVSKLLRDVSDAIILPHYQNLRTEDIEQKSPGDLVTIADKLSEEMLHEGLSKLDNAAEIVGEEAAAADPSVLNRLNSERAWIIDPIDGTGNFAAGKPPFGIIIALTEHGRTIAGWLYNPLTCRICYAAENYGAYVNGERIKSIRNPTRKPIAALATGFMKREQADKIMERAHTRFEIVDIPRCAAEQYALLAHGEHNVTVFERTLAWDHAAGVLFLNEAGGKVARWDGSDYLPGDDRTGLLGATSPELWNEAAVLLSNIFVD